MCEFIRGSTHACGHPRTRTITQRCAASLSSGIRCAVPKPEITATRCHECQDTIQRTASWGDVQKALREQSEASFVPGYKDGGFGSHGRSRSEGVLLALGQGGNGVARTEGKRESGGFGGVVKENERPQREVDLPEIVVSTPLGSREKAGRDGDGGSGGRRG